MKGWTRKLAALGTTALICAPSAHGNGKLELDIYASPTLPPRTPADGPVLPLYGWVPGDPRAERGEPTWVKHLSHVGYAGLGAAGLAGSIASGGVAPAIGFGIVTLISSFLEWQEIKKSPSGKPD